MTHATLPATRPGAGAAASRGRRLVTALSGAAALVAVALPSLPARAEAAMVTTRVNVASDGTEANADISSPAAISADGRYVAFASNASNLVVADTNEAIDVFVHDRQARVTTRVSVAGDGTQANGASRTRSTPAMSADGRYVAFASDASNLAAGDTNGRRDVFVHDRQSGATTRVSVAADGTQGDGASDSPALSGGGRAVAFESSAANLVVADTNGGRDIFVRDRDADGDGVVDQAAPGAATTTKVSTGLVGAPALGPSQRPGLSADGRYVSFSSHASNLVAGDTNGWEDVFVHDRQAGVTTRVSVAADGTEGNNYSLGPAISADSRYVAFESGATNLAANDADSINDILVHDRLTGAISRVSGNSSGLPADGASAAPVLSADGRYVAFQSSATNLVAGDTNRWEDVFVRDRQAGATTRASVASDGTEGNNHSGVPAISADGTVVAFISAASNLVAGETNGATIDVYARAPSPADFSLAATPAAQVVTPGQQASFGVAVTATGGFAAPVALSVAGLPAGATATFSPNPATSTSTMVVATAPTTPTGDYALTITGTGGGLTRTTAATLSVRPPPDFSLAVAPANQTLRPGEGATYAVTIAATGGFAQSVTLSVSGLPAGATGSFTPNPATTSSQLSVTTSRSVKPRTYTLTVTGTGGGLTRTATATLTVARK